MACQTQQSMASWYLFDSTIRKVGSTNVALRHLPLEATNEGLGKEEAQFDYFDGSCIQGFGNARHQGYGKIQQRDPLSGAQ